ncbi:hypothetical protein [Marinilabilia sp.]|uniref:hypothetical protein n=1 Tax=Marinilabilia sp. TaxID=2021252 RepID=UPI0025BF55A9|nr:hypothetical protein [Marinilabilia sp.]
MKRIVHISLHLLLWGMIFFTLLNIQNALTGFPKPQGYNFLTDPDLHLKSLWVIGFLLVPFYFGYLTLPRLLNGLKKRKWLVSLVLFMVIFPVLASIWDDGFRPGVFLQSVFLFSFLNLFLMMGLGFRSIFMLVEKT